jgi:hypothetical protein
MKSSARICAVVGFSLAALCAVAADPAPPPDASAPLRILFIGTSLTYMYGVPTRLASLASNAGESRQVDTTDASRPDTGLRAHWEGRARDLVREARWDYVVLQGPFYTTLSSPGEFRDYARLFDGEIRKAGARTVLFLHWMPPRDREGQEKLNEIYLQSARELDAIVAPVGAAWQLALARDAGISLYRADGKNPTQMGSYLTGCVFYSLFFGKPLPAVEPADGSENVARKAAWDAVQGLRAP